MPRKSIVPLLLGLFTLNPLTASFDAEEQAEIKKLVHDYLIENPQVLVEVSKALRKQQFEEQQKATVSAVMENMDEVTDTNGLSVGNVKGSVTVVEFFDYQCGYCVSSHAPLKRLTRAQDDVHVILHQLPVLGEVSGYAARAVIAAKEQDLAVELHNALMERTPGQRLTVEIVLDHANSVGLDVSKLTEDMEKPEVFKRLTDSIELATKLKIRATPAFILMPNPTLNADQVVYTPGAMNDQMLQQLIERIQSAE